MSDELASGDMPLADGNDLGDPFSRLEAAFIAQESQVENSDETPAEEAEEAATPEPEAETEPEKDAEEADETVEAAPDAEPEADAADFDALERKDGEYLDADGLKAKFPRNSSKELIAEAARYSEAAKRGSEVIEAIGGEEFVPGMTAIASSLKDGNYRDALGGIAETAGPEALVFTIAETMKLGFVEADALAASDDPAKAHFGKTMLAVVDSVIEQRFGPEMSIAKLNKLAQWEQAGWFEKIEKWAEESYVDHDELDELLEVTNDPKLVAAKQELKRLETQLAETKNKAQESTATKQTEVENSFSTMAADQIGKVLSDVVWKSSPLRDISTDTAEIKDEKALMRSYLINDAIALFESDTAKQKLLEGYKTGQSKTAVFQSKFAEAINKAILGTRTKTATAERILAKSYGLSRNTQLAKKQNRTQEIQPATTASTRTPTVTTEFGSEKLDPDTLRARLEARIAGVG